MWNGFSSSFWLQTSFRIQRLIQFLIKPTEKPVQKLCQKAKFSVTLPLAVWRARSVIIVAKIIVTARDLVCGAHHAPRRDTRERWGVWGILMEWWRCRWWRTDAPVHHYLFCKLKEWKWWENWVFRTPNVALHSFAICNVDFAKLGLQTCDTWFACHFEYFLSFLVFLHIFGILKDVLPFCEFASAW
jgi:hypothetical protein